MTKIKQQLIDDIAQMEADVLLENLNDPEMRKNPAFLSKVRQFLKDNNFLTTAETPGVQEIIRTGTTIPDLVSEEHLN
jgi:hypothetical protein